LRKEGLLDKNIPKLLKEETKFHEENISKQLYKDYSAFKNKFFENIVKNNPQYDKLLLFKKSQKFLDRILFVLFAEDKELIPTNAISRIVESWALAGEMHYKPLYELFTILFEHLNVGHTYKSGYEIPAYNGGLFSPDEILDNLKVDDEILKDDLLTLSKYDFNTDVDVNILGHIFEHSLNEIEEIEAQLKGEVADKTKGKRKKDGVFYTPKYITKYIVDNTVGKLCSEKKNALGLDIDFDVQDYQKSNGSVNVKGKELFHTLESYKEWLLKLKILDPACGSGAFLNQALTFLIEEHKNIDDLICELTNTPLRLFDTDKAILENNIFGVDINDESVEIAKLSLWLRTAQKGRKLSNLNNNIKCGNSLIDDPEFAGDKAFNWEKEFPKIFAKGGFDVVIGNPPYVRQELFSDIKPYLEENYSCYNSVADLYTYFIEKGIQLMNKQGLFSFILPNKFLKANYGNQIRKVINENSNLELLFDFEDFPVFSDATTYPIIYVLNKNLDQKKDCFTYSVITKKDSSPDPLQSLETRKKSVSFSSLTDDAWSFVDQSVSEVISKINLDSISLKDFVDNKIFRGVSTGCNDVFIVPQEIKNKISNSNVLKKIYMGKEVKRYKAEFQNLYLTYVDWEYDIESNQDLKAYLLENREQLEMRPEVKQGRFNWWCLSRYGSKNAHLLQEPKIIYPRINNRCNFYLDETGEYSLSDNNFFISSGSKALLAFLNSSLTFFFLKNNCTTLQGGYWDFRRPSVEKIPIHKELSKIYDDLEKYGLKQLDNGRKELSLKNGFLKYLHSQVEIEKISKKLENWEDLEFGDFIKELNKAIKKSGGEKLSKMDEMEWMEVFETKKEEAQTLQAEIDKTDKEIDKMVYELYDLTEEEIQIVENN
jgi:hypothetical protein